jgi:hypothetical protein
MVSQVLFDMVCDDLRQATSENKRLEHENKRLRQVCADAARKISEDVRDDGPCGREALTDVYIMLNEAANGGGE